MARYTVGVLIAALALVGCTKLPAEVAVNDQVPADQRTESEGAGGGTEAPGGEGATWVAIDIDFAEAPEEIASGGTEITLINEGAAVHNVTIDEVGDEPIVQADGGETVSGEVELEPGTYRFYCSIPGHEPTMNGEITVN